jgi:hypothetical protein
LAPPKAEIAVEIFRFWRWRLDPQRPVIEQVIRTEDAVVAVVPELRGEIGLRVPAPPPYDLADPARDDR